MLIKENHMNDIKKYVQSAFYTGIIKSSSLFKISYIIGSHCAWFSVSSVITPLSGAFLGVSGVSCILLLRILIHCVFFKVLSLNFLALCIPGYCASLYWATRSSVIRAVLPAVCIVLFVAHPVGSQVFVYSFYWLIPVILYAVSRRSIFLDALGSTFVAHAVGSVIWLYTVPSTAFMWYNLIPIVVVERLLFAVSMVVVYRVVLFVQNKIKTKEQQIFATVLVQE